MSNCGNCRKTCSCQFQGDNTSTKVLGIGTTYAPYQARLVSPSYRPVGAALGLEVSQAITLNTDVALIFNESMFNGAYALYPPSPEINMWDPAIPTRLSVSVGGLYLVSGAAHQLIPGSGSSWHVWVAKNGVSGTPLVKRTVSTQTGGGAFPGNDTAYNSVITLVRLVEGDYLELYVRSSVTVNMSSQVSMFTAQWMGE